MTQTLSERVEAEIPVYPDPRLSLPSSPLRHQKTGRCKVEKLGKLIPMPVCTFRNVGDKTVKGLM